MSENSLDWKIVCLDVDDASRLVGEFLSSIWPSRTSTIFCKPVGRSAKKDDVLEALSPFRQLRGKILTVYGSGFYHHLTYGLLRTIADKRSQKYVYVHIDQHADNKHTWNNNAVSYGTFVNSESIGDTHACMVKYVGAQQVFISAPILPGHHLRTKANRFKTSYS